MKLNNLGFDYSRLATCTIKKKNKLLAIVMFILTGSFLPMPLIFTILYLTKSSIEINGTPVEYGEPAYILFFSTFVGIFLTLSILFLAIGIFSLMRKPKVFMVMDKDTTDSNSIYYIYDRNKKEEIYLTDKFAVIYNSKYNISRKEDDPLLIEKYFNNFVFWYHFDTVEDAKVIQRKKKTIVKIKTPTYSRYSGSVIKRYAFSNNFNVVPEVVTESISYARAGAHSYQSSTTYIFEDINRSQRIEIHPEIKKILHGLV
ncbi:MAG: hypothetical protein JEZ05_01765 [Tenericutes bacterium]|nr:hypothetical protein [Mycoplasmatota bacterium]